MTEKPSRIVRANNMLRGAAVALVKAFVMFALAANVEGIPQLALQVLAILEMTAATMGLTVGCVLYVLGNARPHVEKTSVLH